MSQPLLEVVIRQSAVALIEPLQVFLEIVAVDECLALFKKQRNDLDVEIVL